MPSKMLGKDVLTAAVDRLTEQYAQGHRLVVSFSTGKDSTCALECAIIAAERTGRLPVDVVLRDEEIMWPGSYEYAERVAARPEVNMVWLVANQPIINVFDRVNPYWWVFDPLLPESEWVRRPPEWATYISELTIHAMNSPTRFPPAEGKKSMSIIGLRVQESRGRRYGLHSSGGYLTKPQKPYGVVSVRPIYDWLDGDVWRAILDNGWDYNSAYDAFVKGGLPKPSIRVGPPTMNYYNSATMQLAAEVWPEWLEKVSNRLDGIRTVVRYGKEALIPHRALGETWEQCFQRECIDNAPTWIADRAAEARRKVLSMHAHHSTTPLPETQPCYQCSGNQGAWKALTMNLYNGDPFAVKATFLPYVEPEFFREGAGTWGGTPAW